MNKSDIYYMNIAYKEAIKAFEKNEIPVGAVIVCDNKILAKGHNLRDNTNIVLNHAESIAITKANKKINNWRLINSTLYCTLEPCNMCSEIIKEAKIKKVIYGAKNDNSKENNKFIQIDSPELIKKCENLIKKKFIELRVKQNVTRETIKQ